MVLGFICIAISAIIASPPVIALVSYFSPPIAAALPIVAKALAGIGTALLTISEMIPAPGSEGGDEVGSDQRPSVIITESGGYVPDNLGHVYTLINISNVKTFRVELIGFSGPAPQLWLYNPPIRRWCSSYDSGNAGYYDVYNSINGQPRGFNDGGPLALTMPVDEIRVNRNSGSGQDGSGDLDLVILFGGSVVVNGLPRTFNFFQPDSTNSTSTLVNTDSIYVLHLNNPSTTPLP